MKKILSPLVFLCTAVCISLYAVHIVPTSTISPVNSAEQAGIAYELYVGNRDGAPTREEEISLLLSSIETTLSRLSNVTSVRLSIDNAEKKTIQAELSLVEGYELSEPTHQSIRNLIMAGFPSVDRVDIKITDVA